MRVLILGGDGYLGWPTAMHLAARGDEVMLVDNPPASADGTSTDPVAQGNARVLDVESLTDASSSIAVSLVVPADRAAAIASAGANGLLALVVVRES